MAIARTSPFALDVLGDVQLQEDVRKVEAVAGEIEQPDLEEQVKDLVAEIRFWEKEYVPWLQRQSKLTHLRYGTHRTRVRVPWKGAANVTVPIVDGIVRRWRPGIAALVLDADPVASFTPKEESDFEAAREAESFMTNMFLEQMTTAPEVVQLADLIAQRGHAYSREGWTYKTERQARVVEAEKLFPGGIQAFLAQAAAQGVNPQDPGSEPDPVDLVAQRLIQEYALDPNDQRDAAMARQAAEGLAQGAPYVRIVFEHVQKDRPSWQALDPIDVIVPFDDDPEDAEFFAVIHSMTDSQLRRKALQSEFRSDAVGALLKKQKARSEDEPAESLREEIRDFIRRRDSRTGKGVEGKKKRTAVWEIFAKIDIDGDGIPERVVIWYAPEGDFTLAIHHYVFPFETWPVTLYKFDQSVTRAIDSRGIVEMLATFQKVENEFVNARLNASQILLSPVFKQRVNGSNYKKAVNWRPGGIIPVANVDDIAPVTHDLRILAELIREEQVNQRQAETYIGTFDATLTSLENSRERRTAREVSAIQDISASIFGLDAKVFQVSFSRSITKVWNLWLEYGPERTFIRVQGKPNPMRVLKSEIGLNFDIHAAGTPSNTSRALMLQTAERIMGTVLTPALVGSGLVDVGELIKYWLQLVDFKLAERIVRPPEEAQAAQTVLQANQIVAEEQGGEPAQVV